MSRIGIFSGLYVNTGIYATPVWTELDIIGDAAVNPSWEEGDATTRESQVNMAEPTKMALEITGRVRVPDGTNVAFDTMEDAFIGKQPLDLLALNGKLDNDNARGYRFNGKIFNWSEDQALGNVLFKDFNVKPCPSANDPKHARVSIVESDPVITYYDIGAEIA